MNTAQLRAQAWESQQNAEWADAAALYQKALEAYPEHQKGALADADKAKLLESAQQCRSFAIEAANRTCEARVTKNTVELKTWLENMGIKSVPGLPAELPVYRKEFPDGLELRVGFTPTTRAFDIEFRSAWGTHVECGTWRVPLNNPIQVLKDLIMSYVSYAQELL